MAGPDFGALLDGIVPMQHLPLDEPGWQPLWVPGELTGELPNNKDAPDTVAATDMKETRASGGGSAVPRRLAVPKSKRSKPRKSRAKPPDSDDVQQAKLLEVSRSLCTAAT